MNANSRRNSPKVCCEGCLSTLKVNTIVKATKNVTVWSRGKSGTEIFSLKPNKIPHLLLFGYSFLWSHKNNSSLRCGQFFSYLHTVIVFLLFSFLRSFPFLPISVPFRSLLSDFFMYFLQNGESWYPPPRGAGSFHSGKIHFKCTSLAFFKQFLRYIIFESGVPWNILGTVVLLPPTETSALIN